MFCSVLNDHKPTLSCFIRKKNTIPTNYTAQVQLNIFRISYTKGKIVSVAVMLSRSSTQKELQLNQLNYKKSTPQIHFETLTYDN